MRNTASIEVGSRQTSMARANNSNEAMQPETWKDIKRVHDEADRILRAPYDVSLKKLRDLLGQVSQDSLDLWSISNLCQIDGLAALIVEGVEQPPFSIELLRILSHVAPFRESAFRQRPMLLYDLLTKAVSSELMFEKYATTCVFLLSPSSSVPEPALLPRLFARLLHKAIQDPTTDNIKVIYHAFSRLEGDLLDTIPADLIIRLQENLLRLLRAFEATDHSNNLLCLAIFAKLASIEPTYLQTSDQPLRSDITLSSDATPSNGPVSKCSESCGPAKQFFTSKRASKTLDLVVLKAILACSGSFTLSSSEVIESLKISEEIVDVIGKDEKSMWLLNNSIKIRKLCGKILLPSIHIGVRCAAINFISSLIQGQPLPLELIKIIPNILRVPARILLARRTIAKYLIQCDESMISAIVLELLELASSELGLDAPSINRLRMAMYLVDTLAIEVQISAELRQAILYCLSTDLFAVKIQRFLKHTLPEMPPDSPHDYAANCPLQALQAKSDLSKSLCVLFIKTAMYTTQDNISLNSSVAAALLDKNTELLRRGCIKCTRYFSRSVSCSKDRVSLLPEKSLSTVELSSADWRESLLENLSTAAQHQHHYIVKAVSRICRDLEARCDSVERPLREAEEVSNDLKLKLDSSEATVAMMENQAKERVLTINSLEAENKRLAEQVDAAEQRLQVLSTAHDQLGYRLECANRDALKFTETARENGEREKLAHLAILTGKDEVYEMQALELAEAEARATSLKDELAQRIAASEKIIACLEDSMKSMNKELELSKLLADSREVEITRLTDREAKMIVDKQVVESKLKDSEAQCGLLSTELNTKAAVYANERSTLLLEHNASLTAANIEKESQALTIQSIRFEMDQAAEIAHAAAKSSENSLAEAHIKIMDLRAEQEAKAKEFAEVKDLSSRLMKVMGIDRTRNTTQTVHRDTISRKSSNNNQTEHRNLDAKSLADSSHTFGPAAASRSESSKNRRTTTNRQNRPALRDIGSNHSPSKRIVVMPVSPLLHTCGDLQDLVDKAGKENEDNDFDAGEYKHSFGESDFFTSTDSRQYSENNERFIVGQDDDSTVDF